MTQRLRVTLLFTTILLFIVCKLRIQYRTFLRDAIRGRRVGIPPTSRNQYDNNNTFTGTFYRYYYYS